MTEPAGARLASELLADPSALVPALSKVSGEPRFTIQAAREVQQQWPDIAGQTLEGDPERIVAAMQARLIDDRWEDCSWSDVCDAARALCGSKRLLWRDGRFVSVRDMIFDEIRRAENGMFIETMIRIYIETWDRESPLTRDLATDLWKVWRSALVEHGRLVEHYSLFDLEHVVGNLLVRMSETPNPYESLREIGIVAPHAPGLMQSVHRSFLERLRPRLARQNADRSAYLTLLDWLHPAGQERPMDEGVGIAIAAILEPWADLEPPDDLKSLIERRLVGSFGDPRIEKAGAWAECRRESDAAYGTMLRWLTGSSLRTFFRIIDQVAGSHMWADRGKYWLDRYEKGAVTEAWFALSDEGARIARHISAKEQNLIPLKYGRNRSHLSADREKCLLIMRDSGLWVVEGSHNFKVHIYSTRAGDRVRPYQPLYDCDEIRRGQWDEANVAAIIHHPGSWQKKVSRRIREWSV